MAWRDNFEFAVTLYQRWRGSVLNRAGFLLVIAGIGELTSIFQNLLAIAFVIAKVPIPFADPPPWVGLSLIAMGLTALALNRLLPETTKEIAQREAPHPHDVQLLRDFRSIISGAALEFLTNHDFAAIFSWDQIRPVQRFGTEWVGPRYEFHDPETNNAFDKVKEATASLNSLINKYAYVHDTNSDIATTKPSVYYTDTEVERLTDQRVARMNALATDLVAQINNFERLAKERIRAL